MPTGYTSTVNPHPRYWYTRKIDHGTMIVCRLGGEHDTDALELAHTLGTAQLREHYDSRWLILNAIEGLERNAARLPVSRVTVLQDAFEPIRHEALLRVRADLRERHRRMLGAFSRADGCGRGLALGQHWVFCGETDMGQTLPVLCTECGGQFQLREP